MKFEKYWGMVLVATMTILLAGFNTALAVDINVAAGQSIQAAIDLASDGDVIILSPGTYVENINTLGKAITIKSTLPNDPVTVASTIIDGNGATVVTINSGEGPLTVINGLTITNGRAWDSSAGLPVMGGGGIACTGSSPTISNCTITGNRGDGLYGNGGGIMFINSNAVVNNCVISNNTASGNGGGVVMAGSDILFTNTVISDNISQTGAGVSVDYYHYKIEPRFGPSTATFENCVISFNHTNLSHGGGIFGYTEANIILRNTTVSDNSGNWGGGIDSRGSLVVEDSTFTGNHAGNNGGAIVTVYSPATITRSIFRNNSAKNGGALSLGDNATITNSIVVDNVADGSYPDNGKAGGLEIRGGSTHIFNSTFANNSCINFAQCAIRGQAVITNSILWGDNDNRPIADPAPSLTITYSNVYHPGYWWQGVHYEVIPPGEGNINSDPLFNDPAGGDYQLSGFSPSVDTGTADGAPAIDIFGTPRPQGLGFDMGAYDRGPAPANSPPALDPVGDKTVDEGQLLEFTVTASDPDGDNLTFSAEPLPPGATFDPATATFSWTPGFDDADNYGVTFTVSDYGDPIELDLETITITVGNVNRAPVIDPVGSFDVDEFQLVEFTIAATDPDGDGVTLSYLALPDGATFDEFTGLFSWVPDASQVGNHTVTFYATDDWVPPQQGQIDVVITVADVPPDEQADDLIEIIIANNHPTEVENSYLANLKKVRIFVEAGKINAAINQVEAFIHKAEQDLAQGLITQEQADLYIALANEIINDLLGQ